MPQLFGQVQRLELSATLWLLLIPPLVGAVVNVLAKARIKQIFAARKLRAFDLAVALLTFALALWHSAEVFGLPEGSRHLQWHGWAMARIGSVALDFGLALDPVAAPMLLLVTGGGLLVHFGIARRASKDEAPWHLPTCLHLGTFSMLLFLLGDGFVPMLFAFPGLGLSTWMLGRGGIDRASSAFSFLAQRLGETAFLLGALLLLWGLGGKWLSDGTYQPDLLPRFAAVSLHDVSPDTKVEADLSSASMSRKPATLSFTSLPGAELHLNNAPFARSPWVQKPVEEGRHSVRIATERGQDEHEVNWFVTKAGRETSIIGLGPTLVFREIRDQLSLHDDEGRAVIRDGFLGKRLFGIRLLTLACLLFCIPVLAHAAQLPRFVAGRRFPSTVTGRGRLFHALLLVGASGYLLARLWFLYSLTQVTGEFIAALLVLSTLVILTVWRAEQGASA